MKQQKGIIVTKVNLYLEIWIILNILCG